MRKSFLKPSDSQPFWSTRNVGWDSRPPPSRLTVTIDSSHTQHQNAQSNQHPLTQLILWKLFPVVNCYLSSDPECKHSQEGRLTIGNQKQEWQKRKYQKIYSSWYSNILGVYQDCHSHFSTLLGPCVNQFTAQVLNTFSEHRTYASLWAQIYLELELYAKPKSHSVWYHQDSYPDSPLSVAHTYIHTYSVVKLNKPVSESAGGVIKWRLYHRVKSNGSNECSNL